MSQVLRVDRVKENVSIMHFVIVVSLMNAMLTDMIIIVIRILINVISNSWLYSYITVCIRSDRLDHSLSFEN